jgi:hypothetical protein
MVQFGSFTPTPMVSGVTVTRDGTPVDVCFYDGTTYTNSDAAAQTSARSGLAGRAALVIVPKAVLTPGAMYHVELTADGQPLAWSFTVACS